jgi:hypothetical protein
MAAHSPERRKEAAASRATALVSEGKKWRGAWLQLCGKLQLHVVPEGLAAPAALLSGMEATHIQTAPVGTARPLYSARDRLVGLLNS